MSRFACFEALRHKFDRPWWEWPAAWRAPDDAKCAELRRGEDAVDRKAVLAALSGFLKANNLKADWSGIETASNEALVNALAMMSPYDPAEKQAMLEAPDLKTRAEILVAVTEIALARTNTEGDPPLQ